MKSIWVEVKNIQLKVKKLLYHIILVVDRKCYFKTYNKYYDLKISVE